MNESRQIKDLRLANGLRVQLIADSHMREAAALLQVACGSDDEPAEQPGLAHLLEHVLFAASAGFSGAERLMSWVPAQGGMLNATTRSDRTAFFFSLPPLQLESGLVRLVDMLANPLFTHQAISEEIAAIDAEYQLLAGDREHLLEVALRQLFHGAPCLSRFQVGSAQSFAAVAPALPQALRDFHQRHYHAGAMTLWLQAPLALSSLERLVRQHGTLLPPAQPLVNPVPARIYAHRSMALQLNGPPVLCLCFALNDWQDTDADWLNVFNQLLCDEAAGGLMACLRQQDLVDDVRLRTFWRSQHALLFAVQFTLSRDDAALCGEVLTRFSCWLAQLADPNARQLEHCVQLAADAFWQQPPLDQLRRRALGPGLPQALSVAAWQAAIRRLHCASQAHLWVSGSLAGRRRQHQGFTLKLAAWPSVSQSPVRQDFCCWPQVTVAPLPPLAANSRSIGWRYARATPRLWLLTRAGEREAALLETALRPLAARLSHQQGQWRHERWQGYWLMQLSAEPAPLEHAVASLWPQLCALSAAQLAQGQRAIRWAAWRDNTAIAIRRLMAALIRELTPADAAQSASGVRHLRWQALLLSDSPDLQQRLARRLSPLPEASRPLIAPASARVWQGVTLSYPPGDAALLLYCPLPEWQPHVRLMWRLLALFCQPLFFQRLRVEKKIGYVVSCRFQQWAGEEGIIFALQSPHAPLAVLQQQLQDFLHSLPAAVSALSEEAIAALGGAVWAQLEQQAQTPEWQACEAFFSPDIALRYPENQRWLKQLSRAEIARGIAALQQSAQHGWCGQAGQLAD
ncbi:coenzyme PQQ biosynthesis protein PqqF [Erwinia sp. OLTSP20]|uniref:pyrroloquinoline quinone biosynthesis protein PqqF n=1 Tax=unclassified Erwinia TaxID=2622719 RepID=UPI000C1A67A4|nr:MULTISPECIES: pyrroloquinoline quinone biosynthesis protein PqqF [unclassified Erwinia]PIJ50717.1 coenzyme PQQ biosynthesis protein PqqF [Erwinia sp. OAMSP11]PIJ75387.1 coenzyme PQQ biosynthesis protein PqqF [Erwinia sp. OLSSP12]PIJ81885.1 coenzyme PQQ biosynthesis protein PqqF [Erwinia sp. OLCASP19]PIJ84540.1 coenzyme PQQ biosynthesis protein PqqF [Erwinia sp. OLMTSP26]PIJ86887.1 coenzyme PQQ biosynthesis protein PqqF [Erwinia sp. OLMDSP33]